jgi:hypothetical protein
VALAILLVCPIRAGNLRRIHIERNLQRPRDGRVFLVFEGEEVKNGRRIEFELPASVVRLLSLRVPTFCLKGSVWRFPQRDGSAPFDQS